MRNTDVGSCLWHHDIGSDGPLQYEVTNGPKYHDNTAATPIMGWADCLAVCRIHQSRGRSMASLGRHSQTHRQW